MRIFIGFVALIIVALAGWLIVSRPSPGPKPAWLDFGSLLRHSPGRETLFVYERAMTCFQPQGHFNATPRLSSYNRQVQSGLIRPRLAIYLRNDAGTLLALVALDPKTLEPLAINLGQPGFSNRRGKRWDAFGKPLQGDTTPLTKLETQVSGALVRVDGHAVACPNLSETPQN